MPTEFEYAVQDLELEAVELDYLDDLPLSDQSEEGS